MGLIKEPLDIDFEVENRPLTKEEERKISEFIQSEKRKLILKKTDNKNLRKKSDKQKV